tara:strand:- start:228 stop:386 length:159 start_codon:yes stop_codon:yes gene_type:complete
MNKNDNELDYDEIAVSINHCDPPGEDQELPFEILINDIPNYAEWPGTCENPF